MKNVVKCYKDFFGYFNALKPHSAYVTHHIKIFWTDCELIPELNSWQCNWNGNQKGKSTDETFIGCALNLKTQGVISYNKGFSRSTRRLWTGLKSIIFVLMCMCMEITGITKCLGWRKLTQEEFFCYSLYSC